MTKKQAIGQTPKDIEEKVDAAIKSKIEIEFAAILEEQVDAIIKELFDEKFKKGLTDTIVERLNKMKPEASR